jgi:hypothetical protein
MIGIGKDIDRMMLYVAIFIASMIISIGSFFLVPVSLTSATLIFGIIIIPSVLFVKVKFK